MAAFLRVINALENIRESDDLLGRAVATNVALARSDTLLERALAETDDAIMVLRGGGLNPPAVSRASKLSAARGLGSPGFG